MRHCLITALLIISLLPSAVAKDAAETHYDYYLRVERAKIARIVQWSAQQHSTILFTIANDIIGYVRNGKLLWIPAKTGGPCQYPHPALSHDGNRIVFQQQAADGARCQLLTYNTTSGSSEVLAEREKSPFWAMSWSWDDSDIAFLTGDGLQVMTTQGKNLRATIPRTELTTGGYSLGADRIQFAHDNHSLLIVVEKFIPDANQKDARWTSGYTHTYLVSVAEGKVRIVREGYQPSISPVDDGMLAFAENKLVMLSADGANIRTLADAPRYPRALPLFRGDFAGPIVWSPDAKQVFVVDVVSDNGANNVYLTDLKSGRQELFLEKTTVAIEGWR